eukprot:7158152-Pyramimonas_sp.AAC.1
MQNGLLLVAFLHSGSRNTRATAARPSESWTANWLLKQVRPCSAGRRRKADVEGPRASCTTQHARDKNA